MFKESYGFSKFPIHLYENPNIEIRKLVLDYLEYWKQNFYTETWKNLTTVRGENAFQPKAFKQNFGKYRRRDEEDEYFEPIFNKVFKKIALPNLRDYFVKNFDGPFEDEFIKYCELKMWVVELGPQAYQVAHLHTNHLTNAWYILSEPDAGSTIFFIDPLNRNLANCYRHTSNSYLNYGINVEDGKSAMFPSDLIHHVDMNKSNGRRISVITDFSMCISIGEIYE